MNALKAINTRVKALQKKHPKSKRTTLQKQAGREWKAGKLKAKRKAAPKRKAVKRKPAKRKAAPRKSAKKTVRKKSLSPAVPKKKRVYKAKRTSVKAYKAKRYKRISGTGSMMSTVLPIAALTIGALLIYKLMTPAIPQYTNTTNPYRAQAQNNLLQWAQAAGLGISAITSMINAINGKSDAEVIALAQSKDSASQWLYNEYGV